MELTRRSFGRRAVAVCAAALGGAWHAAARSVPARWVRGARAAAYPGTLRPLDGRKIGRRGKWAG